MHDHVVKVLTKWLLKHNSSLYLHHIVDGLNIVPGSLSHDHHLKTFQLLMILLSETHIDSVKGVKVTTQDNQTGYFDQWKQFLEKTDAFSKFFEDLIKTDHIFIFL